MHTCASGQLDCPPLTGSVIPNNAWQLTIYFFHLVTSLLYILSSSLLLFVDVYPSAFKFTWQRQNMSKALLQFVLLSSFVIYLLSNLPDKDIMCQKRLNILQVCHHSSSIGGYSFWVPFYCVDLTSSHSLFFLLLLNKPRMVSVVWDLLVSPA